MLPRKQTPSLKQREPHHSSHFNLSPDAVLYDFPTNLLKFQRNSPVEIQNLHTEQIIVTGLNRFRHSLHPVSTGFVIIRSCCFPITVLLLHQAKRNLGSLIRLTAAGKASFCPHGILLCLLYLFIEHLLPLLQLPAEQGVLNTR